MKAEAFTKSLAYTLPLYNSDFPVVRDSFPDKERTVDHACLTSLDLEVLSKCLCQVASLDSSVSLVNMRFISNHFAIGSEIHAQLIAFVKKLFQLGIHPGDLSFVYHLDGDGFCLRLYKRVQKANALNLILNEEHASDKT